MSILNGKTRNRLSLHDFAIPERRAYPIPDEAHARNALSRVAQFGTAEEKARVRAAVHRKFPGIGKTIGHRILAMAGSSPERRSGAAARRFSAGLGFPISVISVNQR